jgi:pimeloyl-ACP methyl ester carboxylesterase
MTSFKNGEVEIAYLDQGQDLPNAEPIVLVHGFASTKEINWVNPSWVTTLTRAGRRVIALDNRGHGQSTKLHDPAAYQMTAMAEDVRALMDHLGIARADVMGYSMGGRITAFMAVNHPERVRSAIIGGLGIRLIEGHGGELAEVIAAALEAPSLADVSDPTGRTFRTFAEQTKSDLKALAACMRRPRQTLTRGQVAGITAPVLVAVGSNDNVAGSGPALAALISGARALDIPGRDHMLAVGDKVFKAGVLEFLNQRP